MANETYNYYQAVKDDVTAFLTSYKTDLKGEELEQDLLAVLAGHPNVTGTVKNPYTDSVTAAQNMHGNEDLFFTMLYDYEYDNPSEAAYMGMQGPAAWDAFIRSRMLPAVVTDVVAEMDKNYDYEASMRADIKWCLTESSILNDYPDEVRNNREAIEKAALGNTYLSEELYYTVTGSYERRYHDSEEEAQKWLDANPKLVNEMADIYGDTLDGCNAQTQDSYVRDMIYEREGDDMIREALDEIFAAKEATHEYAGQFDNLMADLEAEGFDVTTGTFVGAKTTNKEDYEY